MDNLRSDLIREILEYLDPHSMMQVAWTCSRLHQMVWLQTPKPYPRCHSGPYYFFNIPELCAKLYTKMNFAGKRNQFYSDCVHALNNLRPIIKKGIISSSQGQDDQGIENTLNYEEDRNMRFWSSAGSETTDANEFLIYELIDTSIVASVHFMFNFEALQYSLYDEAVQYPPQKIQIKIGNSDSNYHYSSEIYDVKPKSSYLTVLVLPELVIGKYIKLELIGKVGCLFKAQKYFTVLSYVLCIGYPLKSFPEESPLKALSTTSEEIADISKIDSEYISTYAMRKPADPFIAYKLMEKNLLYQFIDEAIKGRILNTVESYFYVKKAIENKAKFDIDKINPNTLTAYLLDENGFSQEAYSLWFKIMLWCYP
ncbi:unnamed protein product [Blepharisma stoltei]|uniref:F-box domain-containing protein n=1 Tax=Blepharisma stoltei TaxID=1481888 RepID=A0AAU9KB37_9CILI|nr:unnamed protein product [Blepharisma stoltei]